MAMDPLSIGSESPPARQSILGSFLRGRPRGTSQSHPSSPPPPPLPENNITRDSPSPSNLNSTPPNENSPSAGHRRRPAASLVPNLHHSNSVATNPPTTAPTNLASAAFSQMLRRRRSAGTLPSATLQAPVIAIARTAVGTTSPPTANLTPPAPVIAAANTNTPPTPPTANPNSPTHRIRLVPHLDSRRSLRFDPIARDVKEGDAPLRIGRFTDRSGLGLAAANALGSNKLAFKSKVVSRAHAEIWCEAGGKFFIKDTKSSSGTFLNHVRLSPANSESRPSELRDGDMLQLGVDYQGGTEDIYKCVKIKIEVNREWQAQNNPFNANALKQLKAIAAPASTSASGPKKTVSSKSALPDCCICLFSVTINQALFIAPCSHAFHYKCLRPLLETHHPAFSCPLCRTFANLEEDVEVEVENDSLAEVSEVVASITNLDRERPVSTVAPPETSRERVDVGAETEVEADGPGGRLAFGVGSRRRSVLPPLPSRAATDVMDLTEDLDEEMEDVQVVAPPPPHPLPTLPEVVPIVLGHGDSDEAEDEGEGELPHVGHSGRNTPLVGQRRTSNEYLSEGDGEGSGLEGEAGASDGNRSAEGAGSIHGKRKR